MSIRRLLGLAADGRRVKPVENGIAEMMVEVYQNYALPLDDKQLFEWHMLTQGRRDLQVIGGYRTHDDSMQIVSGPLERPVVHFEAPPSSWAPEEMKRFLAWLHDSHPGGTEPLPAITRAGIAHLYFESIHPFEDGNGRIGRAISERILSQAIGQPSLLMLADTLEQTRKEYYDRLNRASLSNDVFGWLDWFADRVIEAQERTLEQLDFLLFKARLFDELRGRLNPRQEKVLARLFRAGPGGFDGGLSASNYQRVTGASAATTTRDLQDLVEKHALIRQGERKHTRYYLDWRG